MLRIQAARAAVLALVTACALDVDASQAAAAFAATPTAEIQRAERPGPVPLPAATEYGSLLDRAWVSDGSVGYFIDRPDSLDESPWDLDRTYWGLRLASRLGVRTGVSEPVVSRWVRPALAGQMGRSGLPELFQVSRAAGISALLESSLPTAEVAAGVERLREGSDYRLNPGGAAGPSATAVAVQALVDSGAEVPGVVGAMVRSRLAGLAVDPSLSPTVVYSTAVPVLQAASYLPLTGEEGRDFDEVAQASLTSLGGAAEDLVIMGLASGVLDAIARAGASPALVPPGICSGATADQVRYDPQIAYFANNLGCPGVTTKVARAPSVSGWVDIAQTGGNSFILVSSLAGLRLGHHDGPAQLMVKKWVRTRWARTLRNPFDEYARLKLRSELGMRSRVLLRSLKVDGRISPAASLLALSQVDLRGDRLIEARGGGRWLRAYGSSLHRAARDRTFTIYDAAALRGIGRHVKNSRWVATARRAAARWEHRGLYRPYRGAPVTTLSAALGAWISGTRLSATALRRGGWCNSVGECVEDIRPSATSSTTATALAKLCARRGCGSHVPLYLP